MCSDMYFVEVSPKIFYMPAHRKVINRILFRISSRIIDLLEFNRNIFVIHYIATKYTYETSKELQVIRYCNKINGGHLAPLLQLEFPPDP